MRCQYCLTEERWSCCISSDLLNSLEMLENMSCNVLNFSRNLTFQRRGEIALSPCVYTSQNCSHCTAQKTRFRPSKSLLFPLSFFHLGVSFLLLEALVLEGGLFFLPLSSNSALSSSLSFYSTDFPLGSLKFDSVFSSSKQEGKMKI